MSIQKMNLLDDPLEKKTEENLGGKRKMSFFVDKEFHAKFKNFCTTRYTTMQDEVVMLIKKHMSENK